MNHNNKIFWIKELERILGNKIKILCGININSHQVVLQCRLQQTIKKKKFTIWISITKWLNIINKMKIWINSMDKIVKFLHFLNNKWIL